jgi:hypothetical protein
LFSVAPALAEQQKGKDNKPKLSNDQKQEVQALQKLLDDVMSAKQPAPVDIPFTFEVNFLKARDGKTFAPFTLAIDASKLTTPSLTLFVRVVARAAAAAPAPAAEAKKDEKQAARPEYPWEEVYFLDNVKPPEGGQPLRISRAFAVAGGDYDVYLALRERSQTKQKNAPPPKSTVDKQAVTVPDFLGADLMTSSIIVVDKVDQLQAPLPEDKQTDNPYTFGVTQITPAFDTKFTKKGELSLLFVIYNAQLDPTSKKPSVTAEYNFYTKQKDGTEKFFNKTKPQDFDATTLPPQWDAAAGNQLSAGQSVPLASFPEGDYRLEIKVTDKISGKSIARNVNFSVAGA